MAAFLRRCVWVRSNGVSSGSRRRRRYGLLLLWLLLDDMLLLCIFAVVGQNVGAL